MLCGLIDRSKLCRTYSQTLQDLKQTLLIRLGASNKVDLGGMVRPRPSGNPTRPPAPAEARQAARPRRNFSFLRSPVRLVKLRSSSRSARRHRTKDRINVIIGGLQRKEFQRNGKQRARSKLCALFVSDLLGRSVYCRRSHRGKPSEKVRSGVVLFVDSCQSGDGCAPVNCFACRSAGTRAMFELWRAHNHRCKCVPFLREELRVTEPPGETPKNFARISHARARSLWPTTPDLLPPSIGPSDFCEMDCAGSE